LHVKPDHLSSLYEEGWL